LPVLHLDPLGANAARRVAEFDFNRALLVMASRHLGGAANLYVLSWRVAAAKPHRIDWECPAVDADATVSDHPSVAQ
jgi:hypothetical protein